MHKKTEFSDKDIRFMRRALSLAAKGAGNVSPNPMVGAVIVSSDGRIIGEGYHRRYGGPHAEVNAVASVAEKDLCLLPSSTIYVTLEPCSHYGKTPPCSLLLIEKGIGRIVVGATDPFPEVSGRGIRMLRDAGREVLTGCLEEECLFINRRFFTAHTLKRPWVQLKWAQSADGFIAGLDSNGRQKPVALSNPLSLVAMHRERTMCDAIMVGVNTVVTDNPALTPRLWQGKDPVKITFRSDRIPADSKILKGEHILLDPDISLEENMASLYRDHGLTSLMVEGGAKLLGSFIDAGIYDEIRVETSPTIISNGVESPQVPRHLPLFNREFYGENTVDTYITDSPE